MERKTIKLTVLLCFIMIGFNACYYDVAEELYPTGECITDNMSYANDIAPIIKADCLVCHSTAANLGGVALDTHDNMLIYVNNGGLVGSIKHASGFSPMPQSASKLTDCKISKIEAWIAQGSKNN